MRNTYTIAGYTETFHNAYEVKEIMQDAWERGNKIYAYEVKQNGKPMTDHQIKSL